MLLQLDGSHHPWLEDRGPRFALLLAWIDATPGTVGECRFPSQRRTPGAHFQLMEGIVRRPESPGPLH